MWWVVDVGAVAPLDEAIGLLQVLERLLGDEVVVDTILFAGAGAAGGVGDGEGEGVGVALEQQVQEGALSGPRGARDDERAAVGGKDGSCERGTELSVDATQRPARGRQGAAGQTDRHTHGVDAGAEDGGDEGGQTIHSLGGRSLSLQRVGKRRFGGQRRAGQRGSGPLFSPEFGCRPRTLVPDAVPVACGDALACHKPKTDDATGLEMA